MALRGALTHRKTRRLAKLLDIPLPYALGVVEALWAVCRDRTPRGDIGHMTNQDIADEMWIDNPNADALIDALVQSGWLDIHPTYRLVVHDWSEHADDTTRKRLHRSKLTFADGMPPLRTAQIDQRAESDSANPESFGNKYPATDMSGHVQTCPDMTGLPEAEAEAEAEPLTLSLTLPESEPESTNPREDADAAAESGADAFAVLNQRIEQLFKRADRPLPERLSNWKLAVKRCEMHGLTLDDMVDCLRKQPPVVTDRCLHDLASAHKGVAAVLTQPPFQSAATEVLA